MGPQGPPAPGGDDPAPSPQEERRARARMLNYRLVPLWFFLVTFGLIIAWEFGVQQAPATAEKLQATLVLSLIIAFLIGAPIGIRFFNPLPPKT